MEIQNYCNQVGNIINKLGNNLITSGYSTVAASALLPILVEYSSNPASAFSTLTALLSGIGGNLLANIVQGAYDKAKGKDDQYDIAQLAGIIDNQIKHDDDISEAVASLVQQSDAIQQVSKVLSELPAQWNEFAEKLLNQIEGLKGNTIIIESLNVERLSIVTERTDAPIRLLIIEYLRLLAEKTDQLRLGTIDPKFEIDSPIKLSQVFVPPRVQPFRNRNSINELIFKRKIARVQYSHTDPIMIICDALLQKQETGVVFLGGPGAGKSAFVDRIANSLSLALIENLQNDLDEVSAKDSAHLKSLLPGWNAPMVIPVKISLQEFAAISLPSEVSQCDAGALWNHIEYQLGNNALLGFSEALNKILSGTMDATGKSHDRMTYGGVVMLDGLDEVPRQKRPLIHHVIQSFAHRFKNSLIIVTCRTYSWSQYGNAPSSSTSNFPLKDFPCFKITTFSPDQISLFIERWYQAVRSIKHLSEDAIRWRIETFQSATEMPSLVPLAEKPLLLTLMATLHTSRGKLPHDRAALYADSVNLLLEIWQRDKDMHIGGQITIEGGLLEEFGLTSDDVERALRKLAFEIHDVDFPENSGVALKEGQETKLTEEQLRRTFRPLVNDSWDRAQELLVYIQRRAGLLEYLGDEIYSFPHRTFQEFLAACYVLDQPESAKILQEKFLNAPNWWGEVFSLAIGRQSRASYSISVSFLNDILQEVKRSPAYYDKADVFGAMISAARDIELANRQRDSGLYRELLHGIIHSFLSYSGINLESRIVVERGAIFTDFPNVLEPHVLPLLQDSIAGDAAAVILGKYGGKNLTGVVLPLLGSEDEQIRARAAHVIGGIKDATAINELDSLINDESPIVVIETVRAIGKIGGERASNALVKALKHFDETVQIEAINELARIGTDRVVQDLYEHFENTSTLSARNVIRALGSISSHEAFRCLLDILREEEYVDEITEVLINLGSTVKDFLRDIYLNEEEDEIVIERIRDILINIGDPMLHKDDYDIYLDYYND